VTQPIGAQIVESSSHTRGWSDIALWEHLAAQGRPRTRGGGPNTGNQLIGKAAVVARTRGWSMG
jgi:hypothetical protein